MSLQTIANEFCDWKPHESCRESKGIFLLLATSLFHLAIFGFIIFGSVTVTEAMSHWFRLLIPFAVGAAGLVAVKSKRAAHRHFAKKDIDNFLNTVPNPVLYLRSYRSENERFYRDNTAGDHRVSSFSLNTREWSVEDVVVEAISSKYPVVALGKPGDTLPPYGAIRLYCRQDRDWQELVKELISIASFVIVRIEDPRNIASGLQWEIDQVLMNGDPKKVAFLTADSSGYPISKSSYLTLQSVFEDRYGLSLPKFGWNSWYTYFPNANRVKQIDADGVNDLSNEIRKKTKVLIADSNVKSELGSQLFTFKNAINEPSYVIVRYLAAIIGGFSFLVLLASF